MSFEPVEIAEKTRYLSFETEEGVIAFRYSTLQHFRWEAQGGVLDPEAIHFYFAAGTASVVGADLRLLVALIQDEKVKSFRVGKPSDPALPGVSYIRIVFAEEKKRLEGRPEV